MNRSLTPAQQQEIVRLTAAGWKQQAIAEQVGCSARSVSRWQKAGQEAIGQLSDFIQLQQDQLAESKLYAALMAGEDWAIKLQINRKDKRAAPATPELTLNQLLEAMRHDP